MPTKRRFLLFLIVLAIMLLIKRAVGQEVEAVAGWDPVYTCPDAQQYAASAIISGMCWGVVIGIGRVIERSLAARHDRYFTGDLVMLKL